MNRFRLGIAMMCAVPLALPAQRTLTATRDLRIDATVADLSPIRDLVVSRSGVIAVLQPQDMHIRFFDVNGKSLGAFGRDGEGPSEFRSMSWPGWNGDTLSIEDSGIRRVTFIGPDRKLLRSVPEPIRVLPPKARSVEPPLLGESAIVAVLADGSYLLDFFPATPRSLPDWIRKTSTTLSASLIHVDEDGRFIQVTADLQDHGPSCVWGTPAVTIPFCSHWVNNGGFAHGVASIAAVAGSARQPSYHLLVIGSLHGDTLINRNYSYSPVAIPRQVVDSVRNRLVATPRLSPDKQAVYQSVPFPRFYPPILAIIVGMDGSVWLEEWGTVPSLHRWRILSATGAVLGVVTVPASVTLKDVRRDRAWGTDADADGLQSIVRYRVH